MGANWPRKRHLSHCCSHNRDTWHAKRRQQLTQNGQLMPSMVEHAHASDRHSQRTWTQSSTRPTPRQRRQTALIAYSGAETAHSTAYGRAPRFFSPCAAFRNGTPCPQLNCHASTYVGCRLDTCFVIRGVWEAIYFSHPTQTVRQSLRRHSRNGILPVVLRIAPDLA